MGMSKMKFDKKCKDCPLYKREENKKWRCDECADGPCYQFMPMQPIICTDGKKIGKWELVL